MIDSYFETLVVNNNSNSENQISKDETKMLHELYFLSPDMQMLLNLLAEKEGMWASILILSLFDKSFKYEFKVLIACIGISILILKIFCYEINLLVLY